MEALIYLDTHVAVWLYIPKVDALSETARRLIDDHELLISPAVLLELAFLNEIGRIRVGANEIFESLHLQIGLRACDLSFGPIVAAAQGQTWTRDPFDRLIVGSAACKKVRLLTKDQTIQEHFDFAVW